MENKIYYYDVFIGPGTYHKTEYITVTTTSTLLNIDLVDLRNWNNNYHLGVF